MALSPNQRAVSLPSTSTPATPPTRGNNYAGGLVPPVPPTPATNELQASADPFTVIEVGTPNGAAFSSIELVEFAGDFLWLAYVPPTCSLEGVMFNPPPGTGDPQFYLNRKLFIPMEQGDAVRVGFTRLALDCQWIGTPADDKIRLAIARRTTANT